MARRPASAKSLRSTCRAPATASNWPTTTATISIATACWDSSTPAAQRALPRFSAASRASELSRDPDIGLNAVVPDRFFDPGKGACAPASGSKDETGARIVIGQQLIDAQANAQSRPSGRLHPDLDILIFLQAADDLAEPICGHGSIS